MNARQNANAWHNDINEQIIQLFVVTNCKHDVTRNDPDFLVVASSVTCKLQNLGLFS